MTEYEHNQDQDPELEEKLARADGLLEGFFEEQEGEFSISERTALQRLLDDEFLYQMVERMMIWAYEQAMNRDTSNGEE